MVLHIINTPSLIPRPLSHQIFSQTPKELVKSNTTRLGQNRVRQGEEVGITGEHPIACFGTTDENSVAGREL